MQEGINLMDLACGYRQGRLANRFDGIPDVHYDDAEHLVDDESRTHRHAIE
jgi:hypothetical protein